MNVSDAAVAAPARPENVDRKADTRFGSTATEPSQAEIRRRAYERYLERGGSQGREFDDWLEAERELQGKVRS